MATVAAQLGHLLMKQSDYNYVIQQQIFWSNKYEGNQKCLSELVKKEDKWEKAYDECFSADTEKPRKIDGVAYQAQCTSAAEAYANRKIGELDEETKLELEAKDIEYDTMKAMYDTLAEKMKADLDSSKQAVSTAAQDTGLLNS